MPVLKRKTTVDLTDPAFNPIFDLAERTYPGVPGRVSAVVREILLTAIGQDPTTAARATARRMAYLDAVVVSRTHLGRSMNELAQKLQAEGVIAESQRLDELSKIGNDE
jgi:hypothetical protein